MKFQEGEILKMVKVLSKTNGNDEIEIAVLLDDGQIYCNVEE